MKGNKTIGIILLVTGVVILFLSLAADIIGLGGAPGFGYKQILGSTVGVMVTIAGLFVMSRKKSP